ncbi:MAG: hypothetical protein MJ154_02450 [Candidatus Saccharibacteria bacterium]|nr:hypothetical protein [Candidatus Saccharibacteria bacterium]
MAKHKIFIGGYGVIKIRLGDSRSTDYSYDPMTEVLQIFWRGKEVARRDNVKSGDAFIVECDGSEPKLSRMHFPNHPNDFLMYVLGFGPGTRCHRWDYYDKTLIEQRKEKLFDDRVEKKISGDKYILTFCEDERGKIYHLAGMIDSKLSPTEYYEILDKWPYPIRYPEFFLRVNFEKRFKLNSQQLTKLFRKWNG